MTLVPQTPAIRVAAIIPTSGRDSVVETVRSVLAQTRPADAIVVATGVHNEDRVRRMLSEFGDRIQIEASNSESPTGGHLRRFGTNAVECDWYGFLDDDDQWVDTKLERQLNYLHGTEFDVVASALFFSSEEGVGRKSVPAVLYEAGESVSEYLFAGRGLRVDRPLLHTSTLLVSHRAITTVNWDPDLRVHQDWDLVLRLDAAGFRIGHCPDALTHVATGTSTSMSASNKWMQSYAWWRNSRSLMTPQAKSDFLYSQVLRYALRERSVPGVREVLSSTPRAGRPSLSAVAIAGTGLVPRSLFEGAMLRQAGVGQGAITQSVEIAA